MTDGAFGENIVVEGFDFAAMPVGTRFRCNDVILEMTQIGKNATMAARFSRLWETVLCQERAYLQK